MKLNGLRFIIGSGCNYNCFFCHHEGYVKESYDNVEKEKLDKLYEFAKVNDIKDISITGGEPFLYWNKLKYLLTIFGEDRFRITLNSNFTLADKYLEEMKEFKNIEFHINFSSLNNKTHERIINRKLLDKLKDNLELYKENGFNICLNIPVLHNVNSDELIDIFNYCKTMNFKPRFLVLYPMDNSQEKYFEDVEDIIKHFKDAKLKKKYSYGRYDISYEKGDFEIVRCLCVKKECDICKENTFIHITPDLNLKYCMINNEEIAVDYTNLETISRAFELTCKKLKEV